MWTDQNAIQIFNVFFAVWILNFWFERKKAGRGLDHCKTQTQTQTQTQSPS